MDISTTPVEELSYTALHDELLAMMLYLNEAIEGGESAILAVNRRNLLLTEAKHREKILKEIFNGKFKEESNGVSSPTA
jgi:hypothetical protein